MIIRIKENECTVTTARKLKRIFCLKKFFLVCVVTFFIFVTCSFANETQDSNDTKDSSTIAQDLNLKGSEVITFRPGEGKHILVFQKGFLMSVEGNEFSSDKAVVWMDNISADSNGQVDYVIRAYLQGNLTVKRQERIITSSSEPERIVILLVQGEVLITSDKKEASDPRGLDIYAIAYRTMEATDSGPTSDELKPHTSEPRMNRIPIIQASEFTESRNEEQSFRFPFTLLPLDEDEYELEYSPNIATLMGGFYLSQKQLVDGETWLLEFQANDAVVFLPQEEIEPNESISTFDDFLDAGLIKAIYLSGDVVMTEGQRRISADEIYYDFIQKKAIVINAVMRNFDVRNEIPVYIRASKLQQLAANKFSFEKATLTTSEFYLPQISLNASSIIVTDNTVVNQQEDTESKRDFDVQMYDVNFKYYDMKLPLFFPKLRTNLERPDIPLKEMNLGHDKTFGTYLETSWYLTNILGLQEPEGTDSTLSLDYYSQRGLGGGLETEYLREDYYGRMLAYVIDDNGQDRLGRTSSRKNLEPPHENRGRFFWQHRHFLPYKWQLTTEIGYLSDRNFLESFYRKEYNLTKPQETLIYMKRIEDNWGLSLLGKARINDFENELEELPSIEFHWTGQSFFDDKLTFYSDSQISRLRQRYDSATIATGPGDFFSFMTTRNEIDMPISINKMKIVPFTAATFAFEDGLGFYSKLDGSSAPREDYAFIGELGVRASTQPFWKVFPDVNSQLWDLNQLRHVIQPHFMAVGYTQNESVVEQRDTINVGITQRLQTKRGLGAQKRTVDWMRLDIDFTWVNNSGDASAGADQLIWNKPFIPLLNEGSSLIPQQDRRGSTIYGPRRNYFGAQYLWNISDTTAFLSDMNYDLQSGVVQQLNFGFSRMRQPNLSYYVGNRYLRRLDNNYGEHGSNAITVATTYILDPRYTLVYAGQFDLDYGATVRNDLSLIRRYHRLFWSVTYSNDESMDRHSIGISIWPQGVPDLALGPKRYMELGGSAGF